MMKLCQDGHPPIAYSPEDWPAIRGECPLCTIEQAVKKRKQEFDNARLR